MEPSDDSRTPAKKDTLFQSFQSGFQYLYSNSRKLKKGVTSSLPSLRNGDDLKKLEEKEDYSSLEFDSNDDDVDYSNISVSDSSVESGFRLVAEKEQVACKECPHSRHACVEFPFKKTPHESHCELCYCYVCDIAAPCKKWLEGHCDAFDNVKWSIKRKLKKEAVERKKEAYKEYPHPRYMCMDFPYEKTPHHKHCELCYCYVCETDAPCEKWVGISNHCDAINNEKWRNERKLNNPSMELPAKQNAFVSGAATTSVHQEHPQEEELSQTSSAESSEGENYDIYDETQLRVENLPLSVDSQELAALFQRAGVVMESEVMYHPVLEGCRTSRGFGFVTMGTIEEADKAVHLFNSSNLEKNTITVRRPFEQAKGEETKVLVKNLPRTLTSHDLTELFHRAGVVMESEIMYDDPFPGGCETSLGIGYVTMSTIEEADKAVHLFNGSYLEETVITVNRTKLGQHETTYNILVKNLPHEMDDKRLEGLFRKHGYNVLSARIVEDCKYSRYGVGWDMGDGLVEMASHWERKDAVTCLDGNGRFISLTRSEQEEDESDYESDYGWH